MTQTALEETKDFKEHLPLVHILCNPGLRQRHWDKVGICDCSIRVFSSSFIGELFLCDVYYLPVQFSKLVGFDIAPDSGTTLRKMLKNNFTPFLEQMESISAGASKASLFIPSLGALSSPRENEILPRELPSCVFSTGVFPRKSHAENGG